MKKSVICVLLLSVHGLLVFWLRGMTKIGKKIACGI